MFCVLVYDNLLLEVDLLLPEADVDLVGVRLHLFGLRRNRLLSLLGCRIIFMQSVMTSFRSVRPLALGDFSFASLFLLIRIYW